MFFVYILINEHWETYAGYTENMDRRLSEHNDWRSGKNWWTYARWPWILLHTEEFSEKSAAMKREKWYKTGIWRTAIQRMKQ